MTIKREGMSTNVQPATLVKAMMESEPCFFAQATPIPLNTTQLDPRMLAAVGLMMKAARWHAQQQIDFWRELTVVEER